MTASSAKTRSRISAPCSTGLRSSLTLDKSRVMVTGVSYGGFMTYAVAEPTAIACDARSPHQGSRQLHHLFPEHRHRPGRRSPRRIPATNGSPKVREFLTRLSPVTQASKLRIPLLIAHGQKDSRVPIDQGGGDGGVARKNGVPVWLTVYTDEGHLLPTTRANNDFLFYTWIRFMQDLPFELTLSGFGIGIWDSGSRDWGLGTRGFGILGLNSEASGFG